MPTPSFPVHDVLSHCRTLLDIASDIPVPGLKSGFAIAAKIIEDVENLHSLKESCLILVETATSMLCVLQRKLQNQVGELPSDAEANIKAFEKALLEAKSLLNEYVRMLWIHRFFKRFTIQKDVDLHKSRLEAAFKIFQTEMTLDMCILQFRDHKIMVNMYQMVQKLVDQTPPDDARQFQHGSVRKIRTLKSNRFRHGSIYYAMLMADNSPVICKVYRNDLAAKHEFEREAKVWKALSHPNLVQFLGQSVHNASSPFILLNCQDVDLKTGLQRRLNCQDASISFWNALQVLEGITSALVHLAKEAKLGRQEWTECLKVSNLLIDPSGCPILGRNLVEHAPQLDLDQTPQTAMDWIFMVFYYFVDEILFGDKQFNPFTSWSTVGERRPLAHLRPLMILIAWRPSITFKIITDRIFEFADRLRLIEDKSFSNMRRELLAIDGLYHAFSFRPNRPWNVKLFDVGYVSGEEFVFLCNAMDEYNLPIAVEIIPEVSTLPEASVKSFPGGVRRYMFCDIREAAMQRELASEKISDTVLATYLFLQQIAPAIIDKHGERHRIRISDLILVTAITNHPAGSNIYFEDDTLPPPPRFYFYYQPLPGWGYWSMSDTPALDGVEREEIPGARQTFAVGFPQAIDFIQLQAEDAPHSRW